jgi:hypothetical protein
MREAKFLILILVDMAAIRLAGLCLLFRHRMVLPIGDTRPFHKMDVIGGMACQRASEFPID